MQIRTPPLSGNQRQKPPLRPSTVVLWSQRAKEEREREREGETHLSVCRIPPPTT